MNPTTKHYYDKMMKSDRCVRVWQGLKEYYSLSVLVVITTFALLGQSCRTTKQVLQTDSRDSLRYNEKLVVRPVTIPMSRTGLNLTMDDLRNLPPGASFTAKSGQAKAQLIVKNDTIFIAATCDSLQSLILFYEKELIRAKMEASVHKKESEKNNVWSAFKWCSAGILIGFITGVLFIKTKQKWQK